MGLFISGLAVHSEERKVQALYILVVGKSPQAPLKIVRTDCHNTAVCTAQKAKIKT
jgi:hypothetical protein